MCNNKKCFIKFEKIYVVKVLVCINSVPDTTSKINFTDNKEYDSTNIQFVINPNDEFGLTRAIWLKEKQNATVDVINIGQSQSDKLLKKCLAIGADNAYRVNIEAINGEMVANEIINFIKSKNHYDLIIAGRESIDYNGGMVAGFIASKLNFPFVTNCVGLKIENNIAYLTREIDGGRENIKCNLPIVVGSQKGLVEESDLKIPNMRGIMLASKKEIKVLEPSKYVSSSKIIRFEKPSEKKEIKMISPDNLDELIDILHNKVKVI